MRGLEQALIVVMLAVNVVACTKARDLLIGPSPTPTPSPAPAATPEPTRTPTPQPTSTPIPTPTPEGDVPDNNAAVSRIDLRVYYYQCDGEVVWGSAYASEIPVGCKVVLDATPKDASGERTRARSAPSWHYGPDQLVQVNSVNHTFTPGFTVVASGGFSIYVVVDGVASSTLTLSFVR